MAGHGAEPAHVHWRLAVRFHRRHCRRWRGIGRSGRCRAPGRVQRRGRTTHHRRIRRHRCGPDHAGRAAARLLDGWRGRVRALEPVHPARRRAGRRLGRPSPLGLDGAAVAAFLALLWPRLQQREPVARAVLCGVVTALAVPLLPPGLPILLACAATYLTKCAGYAAFPPACCKTLAWPA